MTPVLWTMVFNRRAKNRWCAWLAMGEFKHVRAFGMLPNGAQWLFYDVKFSGTDILVLDDGPAATALMHEWMFDAEVVLMAPQERQGLKFRFGFYCVPAIKQLLGLRTGALRPDSLFRHCLRNGGDLVDGRTSEASCAG